MNKRTIGLYLLIVTVTFVFFTASLAVASASTIYVPEGGNQTIGQAISNTTTGDTIIVRDGTYTENIDVNVANITIRSENGSSLTTVTASNANDNVFEVTADYVNISGFTVMGANGSVKAGIYLGNANHCNISNNNALNNRYGIYLYSSSNNTLTNNTAGGNSQGIYLSSSSNSTLNLRTTLQIRTTTTASSCLLQVTTHL